MKITTTQTEIKTSEIEVNFPTFTKVVDNYSTKFFYLKAEDEITRVEQYKSGKIVNVSKWATASDAFADGFEFINQDEFMSYYLETIDKLYVNLSVLRAMLTKEIEEVDDENEKQEDEGYEYNPETETMN